MPSPGPGPSVGPETRKKARPLSVHREPGNPVQAIVAPQRRSYDVTKESKEEQKEEGVPDVPPLQLELHTAQVAELYKVYCSDKVL